MTSSRTGNGRETEARLDTANDYEVFDDLLAVAAALSEDG